MNIINTSTGKLFQVEVVPLESTDFKLLEKHRYFFNWEKEKSNEVYKLILTGSRDILGLVSIVRIPDEWRVHIRLLSVSKENKGSNKKYERIAGNLLTHVAKIAVAEYGEMACISLKPKSQIRQHYIDKYNMNVTGVTLSLEVPEILNLINQYDHD